MSILPDEQAYTQTIGTDKPNAEPTGRQMNPQTDRQTYKVTDEWINGHNFIVVDI